MESIFGWDRSSLSFKHAKQHFFLKVWRIGFFFFVSCNFLISKNGNLFIFFAFFFFFWKISHLKRKPIIEYYCCWFAIGWFSYARPYTVLWVGIHSSAQYGTHMRGNINIYRFKKYKLGNNMTWKYMYGIMPLKKHINYNWNVWEYGDATWLVRKNVYVLWQKRN